MVDNVGEPSDLMKAMYGNWELVDSLWGGTRMMRSKSTQWLPREPKENPQLYQMRLQRSVLFNAFKRTIVQNTERVFSKPIHYEEGFPITSMAPILEDVDLCGMSIDQFSKTLLQCGLRHGIAYILVDYPITKGVSTKYDDFVNGNRPYWTLITGPQVLDFKSKRVNGAQRLTYIRFIEYTEKTSGTNATLTTGTAPYITGAGGQTLGYPQQQNYSSQLPISHNTIKEIELNDSTITFRVYEKVETTEQNEKNHDWELVNEGTIQGVDYIPIVPYYANRTQYFLGQCPLQDLAEMNLIHYQSTSDQRNILHTARVPMLFTKGMGYSGEGDNRKTTEVVISPNSVICGEEEWADAKWIEHSGAAIKSGQEDIKEIEAQMALLGMELHAESRSGDVTATEKSIETAKAYSGLKSMALSLQETIDNALRITSQYMGVNYPESEEGIEINVDFSLPFQSQQDMQYLIEMWRDGLLTATEVLEEAKRRNVLHHRFDVREDFDDVYAKDIKNPAPPPPQLLNNNQDKNLDNNGDVQNGDQNR